jgi:hypothetical protein
MSSFTQETHWDVMNQIMDLIEEAKSSNTMTKDDIVAQMEPLLSNMMCKMLSHPTATSYSIYRT